MLKKIRVKQVTLQVQDVGSGAPLLLVHGFPLDHTMWQWQAMGLRGLRVIAPDLSGFGGSERVGGAYTLEQQADDLAGLLDELDVRGPVTFCGLSMGGYIAWQFWTRHGSRLERLILCDTRASADTPQGAEDRRRNADRVIHEGMAFLAESMSGRLFAANTHNRHPERVAATREVMEQTDPRAAAQALRAMADRSDFSDRLSLIQTPALVLCGQQDVITPVAEMRTMAAAMPHARFLEIPEAGHMAPLENPESVNAAVMEFIRSA